MRVFDLESEKLRRLFALNKEERAKYGPAFSELSARIMMSMHKPLCRIAASRLRRFHLHDHDEDVVQEAIVKAHRTLNDQFLGKPVANPWDLETPILGWLLSTQGIPFTGRKSGVIGNYIRSQRRQGHGGEPFEEGMVADSNPLTERYAEILLAAHQEAQAQLKTSKQASKQITAALATYPNARDAYLFSVRSGTHSFDQLNADALVELAKLFKLPLSARKIIREIAEKSACGGKKTIDANTAGKFFGISGRQVRNIVDGVAAKIGYSADKFPLAS